MLDIPYIKQPDPKSCALACYAMVSKYFFPSLTVEDVAKISDWQKGYVVWSFKFWLWIMSKGIRITKYDTFNYEAWVRFGIGGLKKSVSKKDFEYYLNNTKDLNSYPSNIKKVLDNQNFNLIKEKPTFDLLEKLVRNKQICEVVVDSRTLRNLDGFSLHRVVLLAVTKENVIFHDPSIGPTIKVKSNKFRSAWLDSVSEPIIPVNKL